MNLSGNLFLPSFCMSLSFSFFLVHKIYETHIENVARECNSKRHPNPNFTSNQTISTLGSAREEEKKEIRRQIFEFVCYFSLHFANLISQKIMCTQIFLFRATRWKFSRLQCSYKARWIWCQFSFRTTSNFWHFHASRDIRWEIIKVEKSYIFIVKC